MRAVLAEGPGTCNSDQNATLTSTQSSGGMSGKLAEGGAPRTGKASAECDSGGWCSNIADKVRQGRGSAGGDSEAAG